MTTRRAHQFHDRNGEFVAFARRLRSAGCPLEFDEDGLGSGPQGLSTIQIDNPPENFIFDLDSGGAGYILHIVVCNDLARSVRIEQFRLEPPWEDPGFRWLDDPYTSVPRRDVYSVPGTPLCFERAAVLNHRTGRKGKVLPLDSVDGLLLAVGPRPIPDHYALGFKLRTTLSIVDGRGKTYRSKVWLWGQRSLKLIRRRAETQPGQRVRLQEVVSPGFDPAGSDVISETAMSAID